MRKGIGIDIVDYETWESFRRVCQDQGLKVTRMVGLLIERYVREHEPDSDEDHPQKSHKKC